MTPQEIIQTQINKLEERKTHLEGMKKGIDSSLAKITAELITLRGQRTAKPALPPQPMGAWQAVQKVTQ